MCTIIVECRLGRKCKAKKFEIELGRPSVWLDNCSREIAMLMAAPSYGEEREAEHTQYAGCLSVVVNVLVLVVLVVLVSMQVGSE